jgi:hypothetical protein
VVLVVSADPGVADKVHASTARMTSAAVPAAQMRLHGALSDHRDAGRFRDLDGELA